LFHVCPLCNGITSHMLFQCPNCLNPAVDSGKLEDYYGPYSPYNPVEDANETLPIHIKDRSSRRLCVHILYCEHCNTSSTVNGLSWE